MDVVEKMRQAERTLDASRERMARAFAAIERDYARLRADSGRFQAALAGLADEIGSLKANLMEYDGRLGALHDGVRGIGDKSRVLARTMDDHLTGRQPSVRAA